LELFLLQERSVGWTVRSRRATYRAITREELSDVAREEGQVDVRWVMPGDGGFFQPLMVAVKHAAGTMG
jgi:hypothetical protein